MNALAVDDSRMFRAQGTQASAASRDLGIDTMRGLAILMVIGIHSLAQPLIAWQVMADAMLRPCVPIFLFASGYLTAASASVPLSKRVLAALIPYTIAFAAAYLYMALHNPAMDHRPVTTLARFLLAYAFVYYYVFVYVGCTIVLWLLYRLVSADTGQRTRQLTILLLLLVLFGLIAGAYVDPLLSRLGLSESLIEEVRMRDIPFWFSFMALGALVRTIGLKRDLTTAQLLLAGATLTAYVIYAAVRLTGVGDAADYDSIAFFGYAAVLCCLLLGIDRGSPALASLGSGSYFIYLWHIFIVMALRDHAPLRQLGPLAASLLTFVTATLGSVAALIIVRQALPPSVSRRLGA
jgi:surface polysaccharide O-acyltransferase-like enzyme